MRKPRRQSRVRVPRLPRTARTPKLAEPRRRLRLATVLALLMFAAIGIRLVQLQLTDASAYAAEGLEDRLVHEVLPASRGAILDRTGKILVHSVETRYVGPWGRVQEEMRAGRIDLIAGAFFTLPRTEYMDYFHPAFRETRSVIWTRSASPVPYKRWSDLAPKLGVTVINNSFGVEFDNYARQSLKISQVASIEQAIQMLQRGRADYLIYEDTPAEAYVARNGGPAIQPLLPAIAREGLYLTLAHRSRCNTPELRGRLARAVYKLSQERVMNRLVEQGFVLWRKQPSP